MQMSSVEMVKRRVNPSAFPPPLVVDMAEVRKEAREVARVVVGIIVEATYETLGEVFAGAKTVQAVKPSRRRS